MIDPLVSRSFEFFLANSVFPIRLVDLFRTGHGIPLGLEVREGGTKLPEIDPVAPLVRTRILCKLDPASRNGLRDDLRQIENPVVLGAAPDVEGLVVYDLAGRTKNGNECPGDILNVDHRSPWGSVTLEVNKPRSKGPCDKVINYQIKAHPGGYTVRGGISKEGRTERVVSESCDIPLDHDFGCSVRSDGIELSLLVQEIVAGRTVRAAGRGKEESLHTGLLGEPCKSYGGLMVDIEGQPGIEVA